MLKREYRIVKNGLSGYSAQVREVFFFIPIDTWRPRGKAHYGPRALNRAIEEIKLDIGLHLRLDLVNKVNLTREVL